MFRPLISARCNRDSAFVLNITAQRYNLVGVTRRQHRAESRFLSQKFITVQGGYGAIFAVKVQSWLNITRVAVQV
jgi:hypothetical protein